MHSKTRWWPKCLTQWTRLQLNCIPILKTTRVSPLTRLTWLIQGSKTLKWGSTELQLPDWTNLRISFWIVHWTLTSIPRVKETEVATCSKIRWTRCRSTSSITSRRASRRTKTGLRSLQSTLSNSQKPEGAYKSRGTQMAGKLWSCRIGQVLRLKSGRRGIERRRAKVRTWLAQLEARSKISERWTIIPWWPSSPTSITTKVLKQRSK